ncbi:hypothetical protein H0H93_004729 [Arthromyces matolae]|nr:hypothetical protein H0H93_004729 [Arthromyces matolae]
MGLLSATNTVKHDVSFHLITTPVRTPSSMLSSTFNVALPLELILSIIEHAAYAEGTPDITLLRNCSLVSRAWSLSAQKLLFTSVSLSSQRDYDSFMAAVTPCTYKARTLLDSVVRLKVVIDHNQPHPLNQLSFAKAVSRCHRLYDLSLTLYGLCPSFDDTTLSLLHSGPLISSLTFTNWAPTTSTLLYQLLAIYPTLTTLSLTGLSPPEVPDPCTNPDYFPGTLHELRLNFQHYPSNTIDFLQWILPSPQTLRILDFVREPPTSILTSLFQTLDLGTSLYSLSIPSLSTSEHVSIVQRCTSLRELRVEDTGLAGKVWRGLPKTSLRHLALGVDVNTPLQGLVDLLRGNERHGKGIESLTICLMSGGERHALWSVLKMVCAFVGVELKVFRNVTMFRESLRGDPVFVPSSSQSDQLQFPREKSLRNIYAMRSSYSSS